MGSFFFSKTIIKKENKTMELTFAPRGILQIDDARIIHRNFKGEASTYNRGGDRNFSLVIPSQEIADALMNDKNQYGVSWNVKIKPPRDEEESPFIFLPVKVRFNDRGPNIYLISGQTRNRIDEDMVARLDDIDIRSVDLDIRPYDDIFNGEPYRAAYLQSMEITQNVDRFEARYAEEEYPVERE